MPELPILGDDGQLLEIAPYLVYATLPFPNDPLFRGYYAASLIVRHSARNGSPDFHGISEFLVPLLHQAPSSVELDRRVKKETNYLLTASIALEVMLSLSRFHPEIKISPTRVLFGLSKVARKFPAERTYWRHWTDFKASAHLKMAAEHLAAQRGRPPRGQVGAFLFENFAEFLNLAETIRQEAEMRRIFSFDETWRVPAAVQTTRCELTLQEPAEALLAVLAKYQPPHSALAPPCDDDGPAN